MSMRLLKEEPRQELKLPPALILSCGGVLEREFQMMMELAKGIAHVSFAGGGILVPARDPDDRQTLVEHVADHIRAKGQVLLSMASAGSCAWAEAHLWTAAP